MSAPFRSKVTKFVDNMLVFYTDLRSKLCRCPADIYQNFGHYFDFGSSLVINNKIVKLFWSIGHTQFLKISWNMVYILDHKWFLKISWKIGVDFSSMSYLQLFMKISWNIGINPCSDIIIQKNMLSERRWPIRNQMNFRIKNFIEVKRKLSLELHRCLWNRTN